MWNLNLNETKQTNETQTILSVLCNAPCFAVRFLSVCQLASAVFVK